MAKKITKKINQTIRLIAAALTSTLLFSTALSDGLNQSVTVKQKTVYVEVADTQEKRKTGLMWRTSLDKDTGMLFCYPDNAVRYFWMKNTFVPLDIAFIDSNRVIRTIHSTKAVNDSVHIYSSYVPVQYVLEVNQGWFEKHNIKREDTVRFENIVPQNAK